MKGEAAMPPETTRTKATFLVSKPLLQEVKALVQEGACRSLNACVEEALSEWVRKVRRERIRRAFEEASRDPLFLADLKEVGGAFVESDEDTLKTLR